jgi:hypothetical protein
MATFLTVNLLRAHPAHAVPHATFGRAGDRVWPRPAPRSRLVLTTHWRVGPEGRLTCRWQSKVSARFGPPPD